jgi:hypothetical protein
MPVGIAVVATSALLLVVQLAVLPISMSSVQNGTDGITRAWPLIGTGLLALLGAGLVLRGRISIQRHRQYLDRRTAMLQRTRTPESAGVSPGVAGTAHRR